MKRLLLIVLPLLFLGLAWGQSKMDINNLIDRGGVLYAPNKEKPFSGSVFDLYDNGQKKLNGRYRNGIKNGKWTKYHENGQIDAQVRFKDGKQDGLLTAWYEDGSVKE
jgi:antitoxin component YwqK of YwqJK toxin-antitoxin module